MRIVPTLRFLALAVALAAAGCSAGTGGPAVGGGGVRRAALARIIVDNRTDRTLDVAFRSAAEPGREVVVGDVAAGARATVAPVLAGEPIVLIARTAAGHEFRLAARSFEIGAEWTWIIPEDAAFEPPVPRPPMPLPEDRP
ncbi:MAG TPA: hypothetical protein VF212_07810 [Longimicrobiales bacterium]